MEGSITLMDALTQRRTFLVSHIPTTVSIFDPRLPLLDFFPTVSLFPPEEKIALPSSHLSMHLLSPSYKCDTPVTYFFTETE